jgi:hypothetical protein
MNAPFRGTVNVGTRDSTPQERFELPDAPSGVPTVAAVVLRDVGFPALGCCGRRPGEAG